VALPALLLSVPFLNSLHIKIMNLKKKEDCRPAVVVVVKRGTPRKWSSQTIISVISISLHGGLSDPPTNPRSYHAQWRIGISGFQRVLEDDEAKACSPPTPVQTVIKLVFLFLFITQYLVSNAVTRLDLSPVVWDARESGLTG
jgi:hypothetical protein